MKVNKKREFVQALKNEYKENISKRQRKLLKNQYIRNYSIPWDILTSNALDVKK